MEVPVCPDSDDCLAHVSIGLHIDRVPIPRELEVPDLGPNHSLPPVHVNLFLD